MAAATPTPPVPSSSSNTSPLPVHILKDESVSETSNVPSPPPSPKSAPFTTKNDHDTATSSEITESTDIVMRATSVQASSRVTSTSSDHVIATASHAGSSASDPLLVTETSDGAGRDEWAGQGSVGEIPATPVQALGVLSSVRKIFSDNYTVVSSLFRFCLILSTVDMKLLRRTEFTLS